MISNYTVREGLLREGLCVPVGEFYVSEGVFKGRWSQDDELFEIYYEGKWRYADSIDFEMVVLKTDKI